MFSVLVHLFVGIDIELQMKNVTMAIIATMMVVRISAKNFQDFHVLKMFPENRFVDQVVEMA